MNNYKLLPLLLLLLITLLVMLPSYTGGQETERDFADIVAIFKENIFAPLVGVLIGAAVVYFLWGAVKYVKAGDMDEDRKKGREMMAFGIIAIFVMISVWGLVNILVKTFNLNVDEPKIPKFDFK